jgi:hypothetical protein
MTIEEIKKEETLKALVMIISNITFGFNGSDPEVKKKQVGLKHATEIVDALIETEREETEEETKLKLLASINSFLVEQGIKDTDGTSLTFSPERF